MVSTSSNLNIIMDMAIKDFQQTMTLTRPVKILDWTKKTEYQGDLPFYFGVSFERVVDGHPSSIQEQAALNTLVRIKESVDHQVTTGPFIGMIALQLQATQVQEGTMRIFQGVYPPAESEQLGGCMVSWASATDLTSSGAIGNQSCENVDKTLDFQMPLNGSDPSMPKGSITLGGRVGFSSSVLKTS